MPFKTCAYYTSLNRGFTLKVRFYHIFHAKNNICSLIYCPRSVLSVYQAPMSISNDTSDWYIGILLNVCGSIVINLGTNVIKASFMASDENRNYYRNYGMALFVSGSVTNFMSFAYASQTLLAALGGIQFLSNIIWGHFILQEQVGFGHLLATAILFVGVFVSVMSASKKSSGMLSPDEIFQLYDEQYFTLLLVLAIVMLVSHLLYTFYDNRDKLVLEGPQQDNPASRFPSAFLVKPLSYAVPSAILGTQGKLFHAIRCPAVTCHVRSPALTLPTPVYSCTHLTSAALQGKCISGYVRLAIANHTVQVLVTAQAIGTLALFCLCLSLYIYRLNFALKMFDGLLIIPLLQTCWILATVVQGGVFFKEFTAVSPAFVLGILVILCGVCVLGQTYQSSMLNKQQEKSEDTAFANAIHHGSPFYESNILSLSPTKIMSEDTVVNLTTIASVLLASPSPTTGWKSSLEHNWQMVEDHTDGTEPEHCELTGTVSAEISPR